MVGCEEETHAAAADDDAYDLGPLVADVQEDEGDDYDADDGPEVEELGGEEVGVAVGEDSEVVSFYVHE